MNLLLPHWFISMMSPIRLCFRTVCSSSNLYFPSDNSSKQCRMLYRLFDKKNSKKNAGPRNPKLLSKGNVVSAYENTNCSRRLTILNKIYMENLMPMISGGISASKLSDLGFAVSKVEMSSDLKYLNIFYILRRPVTNMDIDSVLYDALRELQENVSSLRFFSKIPCLRFVKDERLNREIELEKIFEEADYGEDYEPLYKRKVFTQTAVPGEESLPKMRVDVLGLNHADIKGRIMAKIFRFKAINTDKVEDAGTDESNSEHMAKHVAPEKLIPFSRKDFIKFYKRRRNMALKRLKAGYYDDS